MLQLLPTAHPCAALLPVVQPDSMRSPAANDAGIAPRHTSSRQVNSLVAGVVAQVAARVRSYNVNIALRLAPTNPRVQSDPAELAFVVGAVLGAALRMVDDEGGDHVGVNVSDSSDKVRISITTDGVPPIRFVRALSGADQGEDVDPTLAHCRRLVERRGGSLVLTEDEGRLGFAVELPRASMSPHAHLVSPARPLLAA